MSKMSKLHIELDEQAGELGFESLEDALNNGYAVDYEHQKLIDGRELAHKEWLERKRRVIESLNNAIYHNLKLNDGKGTYEQIVMQEAKDFIEKGEV